MFPGSSRNFWTSSTRVVRPGPKIPSSQAYVSELSKLVIVAGIPSMKATTWSMRVGTTSATRPAPTMPNARKTIAMAHGRLTLCLPNQLTTGSRPSAANMARAM